MKKIKINIIAVSVLMIAFATGCKKYGYTFADGFPDKGADSSTITVDTSMSVPDFSMYSQAIIFPGVVGDEAPRLSNYPVTLNLDYIKNPSQLRISVLPKAWLSTGLYAPTGEPITIDVPAGMNGLTAQIGCWTDNLTAQAGTDPDGQKREPILYTVKQLSPGRNYIRSPFGGPLYIVSPFATGQSVTLKFSGACKMADYILGQTDEIAWQDSLKNSKVPWFELRAPHIIFTIETEKAQRLGIDKLDSLMQTWEDIFNKDYSQWEGLSDNPTDPIDQAAGLPWRVVADIQPSVGYGHNGYPVVIQDDDHWFKNLTNVDVIVSSGDWGILHEVGHNNQQSNWSFSNMGETTNNLFSFKTGNRLGFRPGQDYSTALKFAASTDTTKNFLTEPSLASDPISKCAFYLQIFDKYGFGFMTTLYTRTRHALRTSNNDQDRVDFVYDAMCDYTQTDMLPFFRAWGLRVSQQQKDAEAAKNYPVLNKKIWLYDPHTMTGGDDPYIDLPPVVSKSNWAVLNYSSQDPSYPISKMLDDNTSTFWNSDYKSSPKPGYPHYFTVDMSAKQGVTGFYFVGRPSLRTQDPKTVDVYAGNDPNNLQLVISNGQLASSGDKQTIALPTGIQLFRYFKVVFTSAWTSTQPVCNISEVGFY